MIMEYKVYYNGHETNDFNVLASWFQKLKDENERLKREYDIAQNHITENEDCIHSMSNDMNQVRNLNKSLENEITELKLEKRKTNEVLKRYCGDSVDAPISTMVGLIIDDYFYQKAEAEFQVIEEQKAEITIDKLNKELVEYADKVEELEKMRWLPDWCQVIDKLDEIIDEEAPERRPSCLYLGRVEEIIDKISRIKNAIHGRNQVLDQRKATIDRLRKENELLNNRQNQAIADKLNEIIDKEAPVPFIPLDCKKVYTNAEDEVWDKLNYLSKSLCLRNNLIKSKNKRIRELENKVNDLDVANRKLKLENEKLIHVQGDNAIEHATEITDLKQEISALKKELEERKNERSPRWWSDVMRIEVLKTKADKLTKENRRLREEVESLKGQNEVLKIKNAYPICPIFEANSKEAANRIAERIRKELD